MRRLLLTALALTLLMTPLSALYANATVYAVHGVPGAVVDVYVAAAGAAPTTPALTGFKFKDIAGPLSLPAGSYDVYVFLAGANPTTDAPVISLKGATLKDGDNLSLVAHLTESGSLAVTPYMNAVSNAGLSYPERYKSRLDVHHAAQAPEVYFRVQGVLEANLANPYHVRLLLQPGRYNASLVVAAAPTAPPVFGPADLLLNGSTLYNVYAVGSAANGTFSILVQTIPIDVNAN